MIVAQLHVAFAKSIAAPRDRALCFRPLRWLISFRFLPQLFQLIN
jgi:hypothetical protein